MTSEEDFFWQPVFVSGDSWAARLPEVEGLLTDVKGIPADAWIEVCQGMVAALEADSRNKESGIELTGCQREMAIRASMFLSAIAKVGLDALIDEATGAQYERAKDALEIKLRAYLETEMTNFGKSLGGSQVGATV